jgi:hypothetical protein
MIQGVFGLLHILPQHDGGVRCFCAIGINAEQLPGSHMSKLFGSNTSGNDLDCNAGQTSADPKNRIAKMKRQEHSSEVKLDCSDFCAVSYQAKHTAQRRDEKRNMQPFLTQRHQPLNLA